MLSLSPESFALLPASQDALHFTPNTSRGIRRSFASGVRQGRTVGHPAQLGGVVLVMPDESIPYAHLSDDASDKPPNDEVLEAARSATASA